jgi:hypothetical protein
MTPTEHCRVELKLPNDPRALGAVHGALQHTARHLGLPSAEEEQLIAGIDVLLCSALASLPDEQELVLLIHEHPNRIEIEMVRPGAGPAEWDSTRQLPGIDRIERESNADSTRLRLVKLLPGGKTTPTEN